MLVDRIVNVRNQSSRENGSSPPKLIVFHTTEGGNIDSLIAQFNDPDSNSSTHMITAQNGEIIQCVPDSQKAWTCCSFNSYTLNIEQIAFASDNRREWFKRHDQLLAGAKLIAHWSIKHGIPLRRGIILPGQLAVSRTGIVQHKDLGQIGCGHSDCGNGFPQGYVTRLAQLIVAEHYRGHHNTKAAIKLRRKLNRQRKRYGLKPLGVIAGTKTA